jgi:hypothetical protein
MNKLILSLILATAVAITVMAAPLVLTQVAVKEKTEFIVPGGSDSKNSQAGTSATTQPITGKQSQPLEVANVITVNNLFNIISMLATAFFISFAVVFIVVRTQRRRSSIL